MTCGCLGIYRLINVLADEGRHDIIYKICKCDKEGSFLSWIKDHGATTSFEFLKFYDCASRNHPFLMGSVTSWFYGGVAGIKATSPGYGTFTVSPYLKEGEIDSVSAAIDAPYGMISVDASVSAERYEYRVSVPFGARAELFVPSDCADNALIGGDNVKITDNKIFLGSGDYEVKICRLKK